jgi:predicted cobalt transporter CbtA
MLYAVVLLLGVATALAVAALDGHLAHRGLEPATRHTLDTLAVVAAIAFVFLAVPASPDAVPDDIPPTLLWDFRLASLTQLATMWATLGLTFGLVMTRAARSSDKQPAAALADA